MVKPLLMLPVVSPSAEVTDFDHRLGIKGYAEFPGACIRFFVNAFNFLEYGVRLGDLFQGTAFGDFFKTKPSMLSLLRIVRTQGRPEGL